jgi:hypothetical protein
MRKQIVKGKFGGGYKRAALQGARITIRKNPRSADTMTVGRSILNEAAVVFQTGHVRYEIDNYARELVVIRADQSDVDGYKINKSRNIGSDHKTLTLPKCIAQELGLKPKAYHFRQYKVNGLELVISLS